MSFFRYPGGKKKLVKQILELTPEGLSFAEPFFGAGSVGLAYLKTGKFATGVVNDLDNSLAEVWRTVRDQPEEMIRRLELVEPSVELWDDSRRIVLMGTHPRMDVAVAKIITHQMSFSGLGMKSGGPLGGRDQKSQYKIDCRWSPKSMATKIRAFSELLQTVRVWSVDFADFLSENPMPFVYLDPPYFAKGTELYSNGFSHSHERLAGIVSSLDCKWLLSYDDCEEIRDLYAGFHFKSVDVNYTIKTARTKPEVFIANYRI